MLRIAVLASCVLLAPSCRHSLEDDPQVTPTDAPSGSADAPISASCQEATTHSDLAWIEDNIYARSCVFSGCHNGVGGGDAAQMNLKKGFSHAALVGVNSRLEPSYKYVVAGQPNQSYLMMMIAHIPPEMMSPPTDPPEADVGFMPQAAAFVPLCVEKREAIQRWIAAGALNN